MPVSEATVSRRARTGASSSGEALDPEPARGREPGHLLRDRGPQLELAALDPGRLVQRLEKVAGIVAGEPQAPLPAFGGERQRDVPASGSRPRSSRRASPLAAREQGVDLAQPLPAEQDPIGNQHERQRRGAARRPSSCGLGAGPRRASRSRVGPDLDLVAFLRPMTQLERAAAAAEPEPAQRSARSAAARSRRPGCRRLEPGARELEALDLERAVGGDQQRGGEPAGFAAGLRQPSAGASSASARDRARPRPRARRRPRAPSHRGRRSPRPGPAAPARAAAALGASRPWRRKRRSNGASSAKFSRHSIASGIRSRAASPARSAP